MLLKKICDSSINDNVKLCRRVIKILDWNGQIWLKMSYFRDLLNPVTLFCTIASTFLFLERDTKFFLLNNLKEIARARDCKFYLLYVFILPKVLKLTSKIFTVTIRKISVLSYCSFRQAKLMSTCVRKLVPSQSTLKWKKKKKKKKCHKAKNYYVKLVCVKPNFLIIQMNLSQTTY